jgi:hypothetical protein
MAGHRIRRSIAQAPKVGLQGEFETHSSTVYTLMTYRFREIRSNGVVTRPERRIPFTLEEFRAWLLREYFKGSWDNAVQCAYCRVWLNVLNYVADHVQPVKYGGSLELENLTLSCDTCNTTKGVMSAAGFRLLTEFATTLDPRDAADMFGRMKGGGAFIATKVFASKARAAAPRASNIPRFRHAR